MGLKDNNNKNYESLVSRLYECKLVKRGITPGTESKFSPPFEEKEKKSLPPLNYRGGKNFHPITMQK